MKRFHAFTLCVCLLLAACSTPQAPQPAATQPDEPASTLPAPTLPPPTLQPEPTDLPATPTTAPHRSVVLVSWDGAKAGTVYEMIDTGVLPNFAELAEQGVRAEYALSVDPSLTAAAQNSIATGAYPMRTGIVSNSYHKPVNSFYWYQRGFDDLLDNAEPVWVTASKSGLTSAAVFFNGGSPQHPGQLADYTIGYGIRDAYSLQLTAAFGPNSRPWQGELPQSFSPLQEADFNIREVARVYMLAIDGSDDGKVNFDSIILNTRRAVDENSQHLQVDQWGRLLLVSSQASGAEFLIQGIQQDPLKVTLFYSNVFHNTAAPRQLLDALNEEFGFFPPDPTRMPWSTAGSPPKKTCTCWKNRRAGWRKSPPGYTRLTSLT